MRWTRRKATSFSQINELAYAMNCPADMNWLRHELRQSRMNCPLQRDKGTVSPDNKKAPDEPVRGKDRVIAFSSEACP